MPNLMPLSTLSALSVFPFADSFPYISDDETMELAQDIEANGLFHPVVLFQNEILDGRNRLRALAKTNLTAVPVREFEGDYLAAVDFVASTNLRRRDLTSGQRAFIGIDYKKYAAIGAKERSLANLVQSDQESFPARGQSRDEAGAKAGVSGRYIDVAESLALNAMDLAEQVKAGVSTLNAAVTELKRRQGNSPGATSGDKAKPEAKPEYGISTGADTSWEPVYTSYEEKRAIAVEALIRTAEHMAAQITRYALTDGDVADATESLSSEAASILAEFFSACEA